MVKRPLHAQLRKWCAPNAGCGYEIIRSALNNHFQTQSVWNHNSRLDRFRCGSARHRGAFLPRRCYTKHRRITDETLHGGTLRRLVDLRRKGSGITIHDWIVFAVGRPGTGVSFIPDQSVFVAVFQTPSRLSRRVTDRAGVVGLACLNRWSRQSTSREPRHDSRRPLAFRGKAPCPC